MNLDLILKDILDPYVRENFFRIQRYIASQTVLSPEFKFYQIEIKKADDNFSLPHGLDFIPIDIVIMSVAGDYNFYFKYQDFDRKNIYLNAKGPVTLRFLAGRFPSNLSRLQPNIDAYPLVGPTVATGGGGSGGTTWLTGTTSPSSGIGQDGDFYLNTTNHHAYYKNGGAWGDLGLLGAQGPQGLQGVQGIQGPQGNPANVHLEVHSVTNADLVSGGYTLDYVPGVALSVGVDVIGGTSQRINYDYTVMGQFLSWDGLGLEAALAEGDILRVTYSV